MRVEKAAFTREMKKTHTILIPDMLPIHFGILRDVFIEHGYRAEVLTNRGENIARLGLQYVHNDTCYPALLVIGQFIDALQSGRYDPDKTALIITQTGGGCRASNYIHLLRKALNKTGFPQVPVISLNLKGLELSAGFRPTLKMARKMMTALLYGDLLMLLGNQVRPYEAEPGETDRLLERWVGEISAGFRKGKGYRRREMRVRMPEMVRSFAGVEIRPRETVKVGIVGEIYLKYSALGNNGLEEFLQSQGCECRVPGVWGFLLYCVSNGIEDYKLYGGSALKAAAFQLLMRYLSRMEQVMIGSLDGSGFLPPKPFCETREIVDGVVGHGSKMGEGWLLPAEMLELAEQGFPNIVCAQPFGCLPNHINGRGMINRIKQVCPEANIVVIDYDPGAARVNQENRIKLMLATAAAPEADAPEEAGVPEPEKFLA